MLASEKLDREANRSLGLDEVLDVRRDALRPANLDEHVGHGCRLGDEAQMAPVDSQTAPCSTCHSVTSAQGVRHRMFIPRCGRSNDLQIGGYFGAIAQRACQRLANLLGACDVVVDPRSRPQRWPMPHMLTVEAIEQSDPVTGVVALEAGDSTLHDTERMGVPDTSGDSARPPRPGRRLYG